MTHGQLSCCLACLLLAACVPLVQTTDGRTLRASSAEFQDYVENVFRRQNATAIALLEALEASYSRESPTALQQRLEALDIELLEHCQALNTVAMARQDNRDINRAQQLELVDAVSSCDRTSLEIKQFLDTLPDLQP
ncbi:MAG: hypothetical protein RQ757_02735 [Pseudomonadales bacterium]|nr:hypothetical protein [Pseudomonadales bacterium]